MVSSPQSNPIRPSGIPCLTLNFSDFSDFRPSAQIKSTGKCNFTPFFSAFSIISLTIGIEFTSNNEAPTLTPNKY